MLGMLSEEMMVPRQI